MVRWSQAVVVEDLTISSTVTAPPFVICECACE